MDFSAEPPPFENPKKPEAAGNDAPPAGPTPAADGDNAAKSADEAKPAEAKASEPAKAEASKPEPPRAPPIPSSALVILPPSQRKFDAEDTAGVSAKKRTSWASYGLRAAAILVVAGGAYAASGHFLGTTSPFVHLASAMPTAATPSVATPTQAALQESDVAEIRRDTKALGDEIHTLQTRLAALQSQTPEEIRGLKKSLDGLKASLESAKTESNTSISQLSAKLDRLQHEGIKQSTASLEKPRAERIDAKAIQATLDRAQRGKADGGPLTTASIPQASAQDGGGEQVALASAEPRHLLSNWIVRDVYDGIALVEGPQGAVEVMPGDTLPGAGTVRSIQRRGDGWIVLTSRGFVDYDHD